MSVILTSSASAPHIKVPKYAHVAEQLRHQIKSGILKPDDRLPSFQQMRTEYGLTNITTEKVYGLLEAEGLIVRQPSRGTFVAHRDLKSRDVKTGNGGDKPSQSNRVTHKTIGVSGLGFNFAGYSSYWARLLQGMRETAGRYQAQVMLLDHTSLVGWEKADGVLLCEWVAEEVLRSIPEGMPCISLISPIEQTASVVSDDYNGGRLATEHLLQLGHRRIAFMYGDDPHLVPQRRRGYEDALCAEGIAPQENWQQQLLRSSEFQYNYGSDFIRSGRETMRTWLEKEWSDSGCTAILAHNDEAAIGIIEALRTANLRVPEDISVIGYDGTEIGEYSSPALTTIEVPLRQIGNAATQLLIRKMEADDLRQEHHILPVTLQVRESCARPSEKLNN